MKRSKPAISLLLGFILMVPFTSCVEGGAVRKEVPSLDPAPQLLMEKLVLNFEHARESLMNDLGGASGSWNMDPSDINNSFCDESVVEIPGSDGSMTHALRLSYSVDSDLPSQNGFWTKLQDIDAQPYDTLSLDVKGDPDQGFTEIFKLEVKKCKAGHCTGDDKKDEVVVGSVTVPVTEDWETVKIPLNKFTGIIDFMNPESWKDSRVALKGLDQLTIVFRDRQVTKKSGVIYLDNIRFIKTGNPGPSAIDKPKRVIPKTPQWMEGLPYAKFLVKRLKGFPKQTVVQKKFPESDRDFLHEVARDTWGFFDEITDVEHGLPLDTLTLPPQGDKAMAEGTVIGDYTNVTNIGVYLMSIVSAMDLGFITKEDAVARITKTMDTLDKLDYHKSGFPYNYYDTTTLEKTDYLVSFVDSSWYLAGLYVVKSAFPEELGNRAQAYLNKGKLGFFYDAVERQMYHGYYDHLDSYSNYHYGIFYAEHRVGSYMAIARGEVPEEHWFEGVIRTFPESAAWQQEKPQQRVLRQTLGHSYYGGYYEWQGIPYIPSWGGGAFEALMPTLVLDEKNLAPYGMKLNNEAHAQVQMRYALEVLKYPVWGMSPSSVPEGGYSEFGVSQLGTKGYKEGVVTPHASILALDQIPEAVVKNMRKLIELYPIYGEYGFYDAVRVKTGLVARKYLALDQAMILISINNYLNDGAIRRRFHANEEMKNAEPVLREEHFFETPGLGTANPVTDHKETV